MPRKSKTSQNYINHIALVLDASYSMLHLRNTVVQVADELIAHLAKMSTENNQETRVTVYVFDDNVECIIFDKDVLRLPSVKELYSPDGNTALVDASILSIEDLRLTMTKYGDHAFLTYVLTDGQENRSHKSRSDLAKLLTNLRDNETVAALVPDQMGRRYAQQCGFADDNIAIWEVSQKGLKDVATTITRSVDSYMDNRSKGVRKSTTLFTTDIGTVNKANVNSKKMNVLPRDSYTMFDLRTEHGGMQIRDYVETVTAAPYVLGKGFYQLTKREKIQPQKELAVQNIHSGFVYTGPQVRELLQLPDHEVSVSPAQNDEYRIFVQSTSVNRKLVAGTKFLLLN